MSQIFAGVFAGLMAGYLLGMIVGFTLFNPDQDVWALLGVVLALVGMVVSFTPFFRRNAVTILMALIGFYIGTLAGTVFFGNMAQDDLLEVLQRPTLVCSIGGTVLGGLSGRRLPADRASLPLLAFLIGGFLGGYVLGVVFHLAPYPSFVGWSPFVVGSGLVTGGLVALLKRRVRRLILLPPSGYHHPEQKQYL